MGGHPGRQENVSIGNKKMMTNMATNTQQATSTNPNHTGPDSPVLLAAEDAAQQRPHLLSTSGTCSTAPAALPPPPQQPSAYRPYCSTNEPAQRPCARLIFSSLPLPPPPPHPLTAFQGQTSTPPPRLTQG
jgi:hypothetical protein